MFDGLAIERTDQLKYFGIHFDKMLTFKAHVKSTALKCIKDSFV